MARAQALFSRGVELVEQGSLTEGCSKFETARRLAPSRLPIRLRLADCRARTGEVLLAWTLFIDVSGEAASNNQPELAKLARDRAAELEPRLPRIAVVVPDSVSQLAGVLVWRDGTLLDSGEWDVAIPVNPGVHVISVGAHEKKPWRSSVHVKADAPALEVRVPDLVDDRVAILENAAKRLEQDEQRRAGCETRGEAWALPDHTAEVGIGYGRCLFELGRLALANEVLHAVASFAASQGDTKHAVEARALAGRADAARPFVSVTMPPSLAGTPGLQVRLDGVLLPPSQWGKSTFDPGPHTVSVTATCREAFSRSKTLSPGETWGLRLNEETFEYICPLPAWVWITGGVGVALAFSSAVLAAEAVGVQGEVDDHCEGRNFCRLDDGFDPATANADFGRSLGLSVGFGVGALGAFSAALWGVSTSSNPAVSQTANRSPQIQILPLGAAVGGVF